MVDTEKFLWHVPVTQNLAIRETAATGRAVFAEADIISGSHLLTTSSEQSPIAHVILRPYRREVCAWCFLYDRGREWKIRNVAEGTAFCSTQCEARWSADSDQICRAAGKSVEIFVRGQAKRRNHASIEDGAYADGLPREGSVGIDSITKIWSKTEEHGIAVVRARCATKPSKTQRAILRHATELAPDPDILTYVLSGVLAAYKAWASQNDADGRVRSTTAQELLPSLFELVPDGGVFLANPMTSSPLYDYTSAFLVLLAVLPVTMLPLVTTNLVINLASRAAHNAFSIRPEGTTDGDQSGEFLGWGVWPEASFFNHSCNPNVKKERNGRRWTFQLDIGAGKSVRQGQQLCITYLGGDERDLRVTERRSRLQEQWAFHCLCDRCLEESMET